MTPGVGVIDEQNLDRHFEKHMGCMAGFLQLFDRPQILSGKRVYSTRRLLSSPEAGSKSPSERSDASTTTSFLKESERSPSLSLRVFDIKDGTKTSWKFREAPRLSLDSRLRPRQIRTLCENRSESYDASQENERHHRSPSVVARLMGLDTLPSAGGEEPKPPELRRSASESRVPRDPSYYRFVDTSSFQKPLTEPAIPAEVRDFRGLKTDPAARTPISALQRKSYFDAQDIFPEPKQSGSISLYGEIERRLRMRGIDEPAKDLDTLKQILEALQLKGLLHSKPSDQQIDGHRNVIYDANLRRTSGESPIVVMKPAPKPLSSRFVTDRCGGVAPRTDRFNERKSSRPTSPDPSSPGRGRSLATNADSRKRSQPERRTSTAHSPKGSPRRNGSETLAIRSPKSPRVALNRVCSPAEDDTFTTISESSISTPSHYDLDRSRSEEVSLSGRGLLERCGKLLSSIAAITSAEQQPSPVSVLDSSFLGDESSPSHRTKRAIDFKDQAADWETWTVGSEILASNDHDYVYVADIIRASARYQDPSDLYTLLEKRHLSSGATWLHRRLLFDVAAEILDRKRHESSWDTFARARSLSSVAVVAEPLLQPVWEEIRRIREPVPAADDLNDVTCAAISKDMSADLGWTRHSAELSDAVLQIERQIFKDLVADTINDLANLAVHFPAIPRRKLVF
ncbi:uncharacterized protein [Typha latifolia]|uniref:uncharacterized protein n=1 Tax=Typha latifolia TaxID=4733 RepID=UPI003C2CD457